MNRVRQTDIDQGMRNLRLVRVVALSVLLAVMALAISPPASACGWWGDGEDDDTESIVIGADGWPVSDDQTISNDLEVPAPRSGYGVVVQRDGNAVPYLKAVPGRAAYSIQQLRTSGFRVVIDLGTSPEVALLHRDETEFLGMKYFNIPTDGDVPAKEHVARFGEILSSNEGQSILVFSASGDLLGGMWAYYRLTRGSMREDALREGQAFGLSDEGAQELMERVNY